MQIKPPALLPTLLALLAGISLPSSGDITLSTDFSNAANQRDPLFKFWTVRNEIPAYPNIVPQKPPEENSMNCIRLLGGWSSNNTMTISEDACTWDDTAQDYVYHLDKIIDRIDGVRSQGYEIHQLVLDNPPWCFHRGLTFSTNPGPGEYDEADRITTYGNSLPPGEPQAWNDFIRAVVTELVATYGSAQVLQWRFRVHTEADFQPHHWAGTKQDYFDHYANTIDAVHAILPTAKVASHFLRPTTGANRYGPEFVTWCDQNNVPVDFIGITYYPFYSNPNHVDLDRIFTNDFQPFLNAPGWQPHMRLEIPEFSLFTEKDDDGYNMPVETSHRDAFVAMLARMLYEKSIINVHNWGDHTKDPVNLALGTMLGKTRYTNQTTGTPTDADNVINGIFALDEGDGTSVDAMIFNYNPDPAYIADETVHLSLTVPVPPGSQYDYRIATVDRSTNPHSQFVDNHPQAAQYESNGGWVLDRINPGSPNMTDMNGQLNHILNSTGKSLWQSEESTFPGYQSLIWSGWQPLTTTSGGGGGSVLQLTIPLSSFSFQKIEFRTSAPPVVSSLEVIAGWDTWDSTTAPSVSVTASDITASATASAVGGTANWSNSDNTTDPGRGSSDDGTWGTFGSGVAASTVTNVGPANFSLTNGMTDGEVTFTITNNGTADYELSAFHFDAIAFRPNAARAYQLEVLSGDITNGIVFTSPDDDITHLGGGLSGHDQHDDIDLDLTGLADSTLEAGGTVVFQLAFSSGTGSGGGHHLFLDNVAVTGSLPPYTALENWRLTHFGSPDNAGNGADGADPNSDREDNFLEFVTGQDPHAYTLLQTTLAPDGANLEFTYSRNVHALADGVIFTVEWSDTLLPGSWSTAGGSEVINSDDGSIQSITATVPGGPGPTRFVRMKATQP